VVDMLELRDYETLLLKSDFALNDFPHCLCVDCFYDMMNGNGYVFMHRE
jgi:hypothetical protein